MLRAACAQNVARQREGLPPIRLAVNLSARQFADLDLVNDIRGALAESGMPPELLELEIIEGMVTQTPSARCGCSARSRAWACVSRSTISAPAIRRSRS
ncbi:MAG: hypothetical protein ACJ8KA_01765 [Sulfurifustis sp.]